MSQLRHILYSFFYYARGLTQKFFSVRKPTFDLCLQHGTIKYVIANRKGTAKPETADIVVGPVANDQTMPTLSRFLAGELSVQETLRRLKPQSLKDQYLFRTEKAVSLLNFVEVLS